MFKFDLRITRFIPYGLARRISRLQHVPRSPHCWLDECHSTTIWLRASGN